jgi:hypothetical protein
LKSEAARWEPAPLTEQDYAAAMSAALRATEQAEATAREAGMSDAFPITGSNGLPPRVIFEDAALDLDSALKRRRAAGGE